MRKYGRRANEELRGKEADFEVTDISTTYIKYRIEICDGHEPTISQEALALTRITSTEILRASYRNCEINVKVFIVSL